MRLALVVVFVGTGLAHGASAQPGKPWLIVPTTSTPQTDWAEPTASRLRTELLVQEVEVWSLRKASQQFEAQVSRPAPKVTDKDLDAWASHSAAALRALALGDYDTALSRLEQAQELSRRAAEELNREPARAQQVLDTCLHTVRVFVETDREARAKAHARECRRMAPGVDASPAIHPPWVVELLREIDASFDEQSGALQVDSEPSGCVARLNGVVVGETPVEIGRLFPGEYRVQVECDPERRGRVHVVQVGAGVQGVLVDARFDRIVASRPVVHLRYPSAEDEAHHKIADVERITSALPSSAVVIVSMPSFDIVELELIEHKHTSSTRGAEPLALARIGAGSDGPSRGDLALAARALQAHECTDFTGPRPVPLACATGEPLPDAPTPAARTVPKKRPRSQLVSGLTLFGVGSASLITSAVLFAPRSNAAVDWFNDVDGGTGDTASQEQWLSLNRGVYLTAVAGGALLVTAMPLALPNHEKVPWWAWVAGGAGVGAGAFAIAYGVTAERAPSTSCSSSAVDLDDVRACVARAERISASVLAGAVAAPLLTMPLVYLLRRRGSRVEPSVAVSRGRGLVGVRGRF